MTTTTVSTTSTTALTLTTTTGGSNVNGLIVTNTGTLKPNGAAVTFALNGSSAGTETIDNFGSIAPTSGRVFDASGAATKVVSISITNETGASMISANSDVMRTNKLSLNGGDLTINNSGNIQTTNPFVSGGNSRGFNVQEYVGLAHFTVINNATGTIQATDDAIRVTSSSIASGGVASTGTAFAGIISIDNYGTIKTNGAGGGQAIDLSDVNATTSGHVTITNEVGGIIQSADADGIKGSRFADIENYGTIQGKNATSTSTGNDGIDFGANDGGVVNNYQGGQIIGARHGITGDAPIAITNDGAITGQLGSGINLDTASTTTATIINTVHGVITGTAGNSSASGSLAGVDGDGIDVDGLVNITNSGDIEAVGHATANEAGAMTPPLNEAITVGGGTITNNLGGIIHSVERAITVDNSAGGNAYAATIITNHGTITGDNGSAISITDTFGDTITNDGTINGTIVTGSGNDVISNSGTINGALSTGDGNDTLYFSKQSNVAVDGGSGFDTIHITQAVDQPFQTNITLTNVTNVEALSVEGYEANITSDQSYSGGVTINSGSLLEIGTGGTTGALTADVVDNGYLYFNRSDGNIFNGNISGAGSVQIFRGTTVLGGNNSYSGGTRLGVPSSAVEIASVNGAGTGAIYFSGDSQVIKIDQTALSSGDFANKIIGFSGTVTTVSIDLAGVGTETSAVLGAGNVLTLSGGSSAVTLHLDPTGIFSPYRFHLASDNAGGTIITHALDVAPIATSASASGTEDTVLTGSVAATDSDNDTLSYALATGPAHGTLTFHTDGSYSYTPAANYNGADSFTFTANDGTLTSDPATISISLAAVNDAPALTAAQAVLPHGTEDVAYTVHASDLLTGFTDVDGDTLSVSGVSVDFGTVINNGDGTYTITEAANANGAGTISYSVIDGNGGVTPASLGFTIDPVNDAPDGLTLTNNLVGDNAARGTVVGTVIAHDVDAGDTLTYSITNANHGPFVINSATGVITVSSATLNAATHPSYVLDVRVKDAAGATFTENFTIDVTHVVVPTTVHLTGAADTYVAPNDTDFIISGLGGNDMITGGGGKDVIIGGAGNDTLNGGGGDDIFQIAGAAGFDAIDGGSGFDTIIATAKNVTIGVSAIANVEQISSGGFDGVKILGTAANDTLDFSNVSLVGITSIGGGAGNDTIFGSAGADHIIGGAGADILTGGAGADIFVYAALGDSKPGAPADHITDFTVGEDLIDLSGIDANTSIAGNQAFTFIGDSPFTGLGQLRIGMDNGHEEIFGNVSGNTNPDFEIVLDHNVTLHASDFIL